MHCPTNLGWSTSHVTHLLSWPNSIRRMLQHFLRPYYGKQQLFPFLYRQHLFAKKRGHHYAGYYPQPTNSHHIQYLCGLGSTKMIMVENCRPHWTSIEASLLLYRVAWQLSNLAFQLIKYLKRKPLDPPSSTFIYMVFLWATTALLMHKVRP